MTKYFIEGGGGEGWTWSLTYFYSDMKSDYQRAVSVCESIEGYKAAKLVAEKWILMLITTQSQIFGFHKKFPWLVEK